MPLSERQRTTVIDFVFLLAARHSANKFALYPRSAASVKCHLKNLTTLKATAGCTTLLDLTQPYQYHPPKFQNTLKKTHPIRPPFVSGAERVQNAIMQNFGEEWWK